MPEKSADLVEVSHELDGDPKLRIHVMVYKSDWEWLGTAYGDSVARSNTIRMLLRDFRRRIEGKVEQKL
jgi:hypothetical protein